MPGKLHDAFIDELRGVYDAEKQLIKALPKMAKAATSPQLQGAFEAHLKETHGHVRRLEEVFESLDEAIRGKHCDGIAGIIDEGKSVMEEDVDDFTMDACLIAAGQRAEHYEIAAYGCAIEFAKELGSVIIMMDLTVGYTAMQSMSKWARPSVPSCRWGRPPLSS